MGGYAASHEESKNRSYQLHEIELKDNQWIFMYSDGFYDQFGVLEINRWVVHDLRGSYKK